MRKLLLPGIIWLLLLHSAGAQGVQNSDFFYMFGVDHIGAQTIPGSAVTLQESTGLSFNYGYGYQIMRWSAASLWLEFNPFSSGTNEATGSIPGKADLSFQTYTLGARFMVPVQSRVSVYGVSGGGGGSFHVPKIGGTTTNPTLSSTETWHGVFDFGAGLDFRLTRLFSLRVEFRDYVSGQGLGGATGRNHPVPFAGVALHF